MPVDDVLKRPVPWHLTPEGFLFRSKKENESNNYRMDYVPLDDDKITEFIMPRSKDCQTLFELILKTIGA